MECNHANFYEEERANYKRRKSAIKNSDEGIENCTQGLNLSKNSKRRKLHPCKFNCGYTAVKKKDTNIHEITHRSRPYTCRASFQCQYEANTACAMFEHERAHKCISKAETITRERIMPQRAAKQMLMNAIDSSVSTDSGGEEEVTVDTSTTKSRSGGYEYKRLRITRKYKVKTTSAEVTMSSVKKNCVSSKVGTAPESASILSSTLSAADNNDKQSLDTDDINCFELDLAFLEDLVSNDFNASYFGDSIFSSTSPRNNSPWKSSSNANSMYDLDRTMCRPSCNSNTGRAHQSTSGNIEKENDLLSFPLNLFEDMILGKITM